jgi:anti-sigma regulatory factor (Ser/Thr protein kinase)
VYQRAFRLLEYAIPSGEIFVIRRVGGTWLPMTASGKPLGGLSEILTRASGSDRVIRLENSALNRERSAEVHTLAVRQEEDPLEWVGLVSAAPSPPTDEQFETLVEAAPFISWLVETAQPSGEHPRSKSGRRLAPVSDRAPRGLHMGEWMALRSLEVDAFVKASKRVGGDFFDVVGLGDDEAVVCLGDVSGKGPQAALLAALARTGFHAAVRVDDDPARILQMMNGLLSPALERVQAFITVAVARLTSDPLGLDYASAGHVEPVVWHTGVEQLELLPATGLPLGVVPGTAYVGLRIGLEPGSVVVLYSDGVTEAEDPDGKVLGLQGLSDMIHACHSAPAASQVEMIIAGMDIHCRGLPLRDDVAILLVRTSRHEQDGPRVVPFIIPAEVAAVRMLVDLTRREVLSAGSVPESRRPELADALATAVAELAANQIEHAYGGSPGRIQGRLTIAGDRLEADLYDSGNEYVEVESIPFDRRDPPLRGYGLKMVRSLADECSYRRLDGSRNHWHLVKHIGVGGRDGHPSHQT